MIEFSIFLIAGLYAQKLKKEVHFKMTKYCPECGGMLEFKGFNLGIFDPTVSCGSFVYYFCLKCESWWRNNQLGIVAKPTNLEKVSSSVIRQLKKK